MEEKYYYIEFGISMLIALLFAYIFEQNVPNVPAIFRLICVPLLISYAIMSLINWFPYFK